MSTTDTLKTYRRRLLVYTVACGIEISQLTACGEKNIKKIKREYLLKKNLIKLQSRELV